MSLGAALLAHHPAGEPLRNPEHGAQCLNGPSNVGDGLAWSAQLLNGVELADDLLYGGFVSW
jgi:hypothetical protein